MATNENEIPRWAKILISVVFTGIIVWAIIPGKILYPIIGAIVAVAAGVSYLIYRKRGIEPFKSFAKKSYEWFKGGQQQVTTQYKQTSKTKPVKVPPLSGRERAEIINAVGTKCENPNCRKKYPLEVHHIKPRAEGGTNKLNNLIVLCNNCHGEFQGGIYSKELLRQWISGKNRRRFRYYLKWNY